MKNNAVVGEHKIKVCTDIKDEKLNFEKYVDDYIEKNKKDLQFHEIIDIQKLM